ncbi:MAG: hypothetical protein R2714_13760 [Microthrixaceae bacterium]
MSITSGERHDLHTRLAEILGEDHANTLMEHLPPVGWADVATKRDLDNVEVALSGDIANLGTQLRSELAAQGSELRGEIATLGTELRGEITTLGTELGGEITTLGNELRNDMATLGTKIDVESISRKSDMDRLMSSVLREQRIFLTAIFLAISALAALGTIFG